MCLMFIWIMEAEQREPRTREKVGMMILPQFYVNRVWRSRHSVDEFSSRQCRDENLAHESVNHFQFLRLRLTRDLILSLAKLEGNVPKI